MDGFDDLMNSSRRVLEENPFEDPFAKDRSNSPDPWASLGATVHASSHNGDAFQSGFADVQSATYAAQFYENPHRGSNEQESSGAPAEADPLEAAYTTADIGSEAETEATNTTSPRTPGFAIFSPSIDDQTRTVTEPEPGSPSPPSAPLESIISPSSRPPESLANDPIRASTAPSVPSSSRIESAFATPLDQRIAVTSSNSFSGLALGGESAGGWQGDQGVWVNDTHIASVLSQKIASHDVEEDEDDEDDKPIGQTAKFQAAERDRSLQARSDATSSQRQSGIHPIFTISVEDPQKVGDPIRGFTMYTVHTRTSSPLFQKSTFSVLRRYSDFLWLYETLSMNNPGVVVPPVPGKNPFGRFADTFVQQRRSDLEKCINKMANHPVLAKDPDLRMFLESDSFALDIKHRKAEISQERGGLMASIGQTLAAPRFYETDEWFDKQKTYLDGLESQLRGLVKSIELVAKHRSEMATATGEFAQAVGDLSTSDIGQQLQQSLASIADVERKAGELQSIQSQEDMLTLMSTADEYARLINSVRLAFNSRIRTWHHWQSADADVRRVKQSHEKARAQGRITTDRIGHSLSQLAEVERRALDTKQEFDHCSRLIKSEVARFELERIDDFKNSLQAFLEGMISRQKEIISSREAYQQTLLKRVNPSQTPSAPLTT